MFMGSRKKYILYLLLCLWLGIIFFFSNQPGVISIKQSDSIIYKITDIVSKKDEETIKHLSTKWTFLIRKTAHFLEFFILGLIIYLVLDIRKIKYTLITAIILAILFASLDEIHQLFVVGRTAKVFDVFIDSIGSFLAIIIVDFIKKKKINKHIIS